SGLRSSCQPAPDSVVLRRIARPLLLRLLQLGARRPSTSSTCFSEMLDSRTSCSQSDQLIITETRAGRICGGGRLEIQQAVHGGQPDQVPGRVSVKFAQDACAVGLDRAGADAQLRGDLCGAQTADDKTEDLTFTAGENG